MKRIATHFCSLMLFCLSTGASLNAQIPLLNGSNSDYKVPFEKTTVVSAAARIGGSGIPDWPPAKVKIGYIVPSNRTPQANYKENLQFAIEMAQMWFRDNMEQNGFGPKTFIFETEEDSPRPKIHLVNVPETDSYLRGNNGGELFDRTRFAAKNAGLTIDLEGEVWVLIPETQVQLPDGSFIGGLAMGGGGESGNGNRSATAELGSNVIQLFNPQRLLDNTNYAGQIVPELGPYPLVQDVSFAWFEKNTFSTVASSYLGALCHEMGHAFGLRHDARHDENFFGGLMGNGLRGIRGSFFPALYPNDYTRLEYGAALMLNESYYFNRHRKASLYRPNLTVLTNGTVSPVVGGGLLNIRFVASGSDSIAYAHLYDNNGQLIDELVINRLNIDTTFRTPYYQAGTTNSFSIAVGDRQGNRTVSPGFTLSVTVGNQAPKPYLKIYYPNAPYSGNGTRFDAGYTTDSNGDSFTAEFDVNNDGVFETPALNAHNYDYVIPQTGPYRARIRVTDSNGASAVSSPVSGNYGKNCGIDPPIIYGVNTICPGSATKLSVYGCYGTFLWSNGETTPSITVSPTSTTNYTVTCNYGCAPQVSQSFTVKTVNDTAVVSATASSGVQQAAQSLVSTQEIPVGNTVIYRAGNSVSLLPGFQAFKGSAFAALIRQCGTPMAQADNASVTAGYAKKINILSNDFNPDGSAITNLTQVTLPVIIVNPTGGTATVNSDGTISYFSNENTGTDSLVYWVCNRNNPSFCTTSNLKLTLNGGFPLLPNADFENSVDFVSGSSFSYWLKDGLKPDQAVFSWLTGQGRNGSNCIRIYSGPASGPVQSNDVQAYRIILLAPYTNYVLKGWVKTENITTNANAAGVGGCLSVVTSINSADFPPRSKDLKGTTDWTQVLLPFNSGDGHVRISCRLGFTYQESEGTVYFDDLRIELL
ncbi:3-coathanger stack domain-containing protein [Runella sp.]|uniref:3-coathanger stack domain-containing protein n=1 Tax=Runella sp. TaxID=1960881 RepID=UPI003D13FD01